MDIDIVRFYVVSNGTYTKEEDYRILVECTKEYAETNDNVKFDEELADSIVSHLISCGEDARKIEIKGDSIKDFKEVSFAEVPDLETLKKIWPKEKPFKD